MKVAAVQLNAKADQAANIAAADRLTRAAAAEGASLIVLPEKWNAIGTDADMRAAAQDLDGPAVAWAKATARELGVELIAGSILERAPGMEKPANTSLHIDAAGEIRAAYRKIHMFDVEVAGRTYRESALEQAGEEAVLTRTRDGVEVGLSVCYDVRFPELYAALAAAGARILTVPAAFTLATTREHWEPLLRARAIENQAFVIAANQIGAHPGGQESGGRSMVVDPWGVVLAKAPDSECALSAELDLSQQERIRRRLPSLASRRPQAYHVRGRQPA